MRARQLMLALVALLSAARGWAQGCETDPKFMKEVAAARVPHQQPVFELDHWKKANKLAGGACQECLLQMAYLQARMGDVKAVVATTEDLEARAPSAQTRASAESLRGIAHVPCQP